MIFVLCSALITSPSITAQSIESSNSQKTSQQLNDIQRAISKQQKDLLQVNVKRDDLETQLKADDLAIAKIAKSIVSTKEEHDNTQQKLKALALEKTQLSRAKRQQETILAQQLRAAYSTGHHDYLKLILNQEDPAKVQRTITHYQYLNTARINEIESFQRTIADLLEVTEQHQQQVAKLTLLTQAQTEQKQVLELSKQKQKQTLQALNKKALTGKQQLNKLKQQEQNLVALLKRIAERAKQAQNLKGLSKLKHKLSWPVKGRIQHNFGTSKQGYLKWKGVLLSAPVGRQVKTIHSGTILFSDWLKGYGLVTVIDHGDGYMSLYGHNQTLLKSVGERVEAGEPIALVGQSGGQSTSGLYFEIRHAGQAVNPKLWCK
jgi:septal ring factor EnvC (AmiA/AmiB activator)